MVVEAHGGHFWSTQGSVQRPLDVTSLRIDAQERMGLQVPPLPGQLISSIAQTKPPLPDWLMKCPHTASTAWVADEMSR